MDISLNRQISTSKDRMAAKVVDAVSLSSIVDSIPKDVYRAEGIVFKEEAVGEEEHEGKPDESESGKILSFVGKYRGLSESATF